MHPMMQRFFWPHLTPLRPSFQPRFHPGPPRPPQEIHYFAFGDFRQARVSETSSEAAPLRPRPSPTQVQHHPLFRGHSTLKLSVQIDISQENIKELIVMKITA